MNTFSQKSFNCAHSMFAQDNLFPSLRMIEKWSAETLPSAEVIWNKEEFVLFVKDIHKAHLTPGLQTKSLALAAISYQNGAIF